MSAITKAQAVSLWDDLRGHMVNAEACIAEIVATKAWEPLGYLSFADAWAARMQGVPLATDGMKAHVVYALIESGLDDAGVLGATGIGSRVGPASVEALRRQKSAGVPPDLATTRVRSHLRKQPGSPRMVHVRLSEVEYLEFKALALSLDADAATLAAQLIRDYLAQGEDAA